MARVVLTSFAKKEYCEAFVYYADRTPRTAERFERSFSNTLQAIAANAEKFPYRDQRYRFARVEKFPYALIFQIGAEQVTVVAVAHDSRQPNYWRER